VRPRSQSRQRPAVVSRQRSRTAAALRCLLGLGFVGAFVAIGIAAASTSWTSSMASLRVIEACCLLPVVAVVFAELRPAATALWSGTSSARRTVRSFRQQLDALPETEHPLGG
jgi:hypothetical protein